MYYCSLFVTYVKKKNEKTMIISKNKINDYNTKLWFSFTYFCLVGVPAAAVEQSYCSVVTKIKTQNRCSYIAVQVKQHGA